MSSKTWKVTLGLFGVFIMVWLVGNLFMKGEADRPYVEIRLPAEFIDLTKGGLFGVSTKRGWWVQMREENLATNVSLKVLTVWNEKSLQTNIFMCFLIFDPKGGSKIVYASTLSVKLDLSNPTDYRVAVAHKGSGYSVQEIQLFRECLPSGGRN